MNLKGLIDKLEDSDYRPEDPEWNSRNINRKEGDTTFKQCGWCEHTGGGSARYGCMLSSSCNLLHSYGLGHRVFWDTPCLVLFLGKEDMKNIMMSKKRDIEDKKSQIKYIKEEIKTINDLVLPKKPPLPGNRIKDFNEGETIWAYNDKNKWVKGTVVPGYRSHDGCVSFILDGVPESMPKPEGGGPWGFGVGVPKILKDWEYKYFKNYPDDFKIWLHLCDSDYNGS